MQKQLHLPGLGQVRRRSRKRARNRVRCPGGTCIALSGVQLKSPKKLSSRARPTLMNGLNEWVSCRRVGRLTPAKKAKLPNKAFGLPESRKYPMPDPVHAKNAKARAKQMLSKKKLSRKDFDRIVRKANRVINACK